MHFCSLIYRNGKNVVILLIPVCLLDSSGDTHTKKENKNLIEQS